MNSLTSAVAAVVTDDAGRVLLCQQSQGHRRWGLPGGKVRQAESPIRAAIRDIMEETGTDAQLVDLVGIYQLTGQSLPDLVVHVFRGRVAAGEVVLNAPGRICRLSWHDPDNLPEPMTPTTRTAIADAVAGRSGVLRSVARDAEPEIPDAAPEPGIAATGDELVAALAS
ncbi:MAG TPA: NUDIX hydrolase [Asanoa sp.]|jgi:8-oxo-dGTP diphosphatase